MRQRKSKPYDPLKRVIDLGASALGLIVTAPIQIVTAALVLAKHGRPIFFRQQRPGLDGQTFELVKFRTMKNPTATLVTDQERLTGFGRFLRSTSLDELPTLWNVLKGDMSLVGPRPLLVKYLPLYTPKQARRHEVRPGVTGLAQAKGRNGLSWDEKLSLDVQYVDDRSFLLDLWILGLTVRAVLKRDGISQEGQATMTEFLGTNPEGTQHA